MTETGVLFWPDAFLKILRESSQIVEVRHENPLNDENNIIHAVLQMIKY